MPRTYKNRGIHTSPKKAGSHNMKPELTNGMNLPEDEKPFNYSELYAISTEKAKRETAWTGEEMAQSLEEYFKYCYENKLKPCKAGMALFLGCSRDTINEWESKPEKYGDISVAIKKAVQLIEVTYIARAERYPTANIFLLKTSHGHIEQGRLDITSNGQTITKAEDVEDIIGKLGLDKSE